MVANVDADLALFDQFCMLWFYLLLTVCLVVLYDIVGVLVYL